MNHIIADRWYLASKNDGLFIINSPPRPSTDDQNHDRTDGPTVVLSITELPEKKGAEVVAAYNRAMLANRTPAGNKLLLFLMILDKMGGETDASDNDRHWLNYFCDDSEPVDTFNLASKSGLIRVTHDSDTDVSTAYLTNTGRIAIAEGCAGAAASLPVLTKEMVRLIIAARNVAFDSPPGSDALRELDEASEAFSECVPWDDAPQDLAEINVQSSHSGVESRHAADGSSECMPRRLGGSDGGLDATQVIPRSIAGIASGLSEAHEAEMRTLADLAHPYREGTWYFSATHDRDRFLDLAVTYIQSNRKSAVIGCPHDRQRAGWTHLVCEDCGSIKTDRGWGIASGMWFKSTNEATFYKEHGRLPGLRDAEVRS